MSTVDKRPAVAKGFTERRRWPLGREPILGALVGEAGRLFGYLVLPTP
jgi:hypothetical protein